MAKTAKKNSKAELDNLNETGRRTESKPVQNERRKNHRRRQIDPTTCEREYSDPEIEFMHALDEYKRASGRMFPTCSEILEVLTKIGYRKVADPQEIYNPDANSSSDNEIETFEQEESFV